MDAISHKTVNKQRLDDWLDTALEQSFPASDPIPSFRGDLSPSSSAAMDKHDAGGLDLKST